GDDFGMIGEAEVVVGAEVDNLLVADAYRRSLRTLQLAFALVKAPGLQVVELSAQQIAQALLAHRYAPPTVPLPVLALAGFVRISMLLMCKIHSTWNPSPIT